VRPVLVEHCYECHSVAPEDSRQAAARQSGCVARGGVSGAVVPGDVEKSLLIQAVHFNQNDMKMPPKASCRPTSSPTSKRGSRWSARPRDKAGRQACRSWEDIVKQRRSVEPATVRGFAAPTPKNASCRRRDRSFC